MQSHPKVSVIVPVYNVEKTLDRCMESILHQTFKDFEVIMVNDGSTDGSGNLCEQYASKYSNIRVIHKQNEGLGPTRDRGVDAAKGEYIYHCDSDDWLSPTLLEQTVKAMDKHLADVLIFGYTIFTETPEGAVEKYDEISVPNAIIEGTQKVREYFCEQYYNSFVVQSAWNRLYRRQFLIDNQLKFPPLRRCQDMAFSLSLFSKINKLVCLKESFYNYIIKPGVFKGRSFTEMIDIYLDVFHRTKNCFESWNLYDSRQRTKLENKICEHIANYVAYAVTYKYPEKRKNNLTLLINNTEVQDIFKNYNNPSRFVQAFAWCVNNKQIVLLSLLIKAFYYRQKNA